MDTLIESKYRYNTRRLPPVPLWMDVKERVEWARCWRSLFRSWRWQLSEDVRYWISVRETVGRDQVEAILGPRDQFRIEPLGCQAEVCNDFEDLL